MMLTSSLFITYPSNSKKISKVFHVLFTFFLLDKRSRWRLLLSATFAIKCKTKSVLPPYYITYGRFWFGILMRMTIIPDEVISTPQYKNPCRLESCRNGYTQCNRILLMLSYIGFWPPVYEVDFVPSQS